MLVQFAVDLAGQKTQMLFLDDNRGNYPTDGDAQRGDTWQLVANTSVSPLAVPSCRLVAWPAGEKEGGAGLDADAMREVFEWVVGS